MDHPEPGLDRALRAIESYVQLHPQAADTERGIAESWLVEMGADASLSDLRMAIDLLLQRGVLSETRLPGGSVIYGAARTAGPAPRMH